MWQLIEIADLHYFPLWEKDVHDCLQARFSDLISIFSHYSKSIGGSTTAEDAVEMTMSEFKTSSRMLVETKDLRFDVMCNMFIKANALNTNAVREQRINERKRQGEAGGADDKASKAGPKREKGRRPKGPGDGPGARAVRVCRAARAYLLLALQRTGLHKLATKLVPSPTTRDMLDECVPNAKRDDSLLFREKLRATKLQALEAYDAKLQKWWDKQTQSMFLKERRKMQFQQWQDLLKNRTTWQNLASGPCTSRRWATSGAARSSAAAPLPQARWPL